MAKIQNYRQEGTADTPAQLEYGAIGINKNGEVFAGDVNGVPQKAYSKPSPETAAALGLGSTATPDEALLALKGIDGEVLKFFGSQYGVKYDYCPFKNYSQNPVINGNQMAIDPQGNLYIFGIAAGGWATQRFNIFTGEASEIVRFVADTSYALQGGATLINDNHLCVKVGNGLYILDKNTLLNLKYFSDYQYAKGVGYFGDKFYYIQSELNNAQIVRKDGLALVKSETFADVSFVGENAEYVYGICQKYSQKGLYKFNKSTFVFTLLYEGTFTDDISAKRYKYAQKYYSAYKGKLVSFDPNTETYDVTVLDVNSTTNSYYTFGVENGIMKITDGSGVFDIDLAQKKITKAVYFDEPMFSINGNAGYGTKNYGTNSDKYNVITDDLAYVSYSTNYISLVNIKTGEVKSITGTAAYSDVKFCGTSYLFGYTISGGGTKIYDVKATPYIVPTT